ncbi:phosphatidylinositol alpha 1,6-mannosyltransferase [Jatrophihabitans endophyticus]|uniref:Phosphatidylinositol alpha 1,6-mannosyltransferase n=2 Tax=Jatrophihabitans endophyticus TaxID=1206085 RepID=A0A1M5RAL3_9ACTN|nr:phosphatidylinositol alpha 1,6-mannosyltransferase [Jatrophihabitans endophyticus]
MIAETFTPAVNGVVNSVRQVADQLAARGHRPIVVAPSGADYRSACGRTVEVVTVPAVALPGYRGLDVARPGLDLRGLLADLAPDVVHLASPAVLGRAATTAAAALALPTVAIWQTDLSSFARRYHLGVGAPFVWSRLRRVHNAADLTLVPSSASARQLRRQGIGPLALWQRGVDRDLFDPRRRDDAWRRGIAPHDELVVGFVGRLAAEKRVHLLAPLARTPGVRVVIVGDGPRRPALQRLLPAAHFTGQLTGRELGRAVASLDVLVHPGADETFCQVVQEALCAGVPVVATASGGPLDLVRHGHNGLLWTDGDPTLLAAQVVGLRDDRAALAALAARARPSVVHRTWARVTDELLGHYHRVIEHRGTGGARRAS